MIRSFVVFFGFFLSFEVFSCNTEGEPSDCLELSHSFRFTAKSFSRSAREAFAELERAPGKVAEDLLVDMRGGKCAAVDAVVERIAADFVLALTQDARISVSLRTVLPYVGGVLSDDDRAIVERMMNPETFQAETMRWSSVRSKRRMLVCALVKTVCEAFDCLLSFVVTPSLYNAVNLILQEPELRMFWPERRRYVVLKLLDAGVCTLLPSQAFCAENVSLRVKAAEVGKGMLFKPPQEAIS